jgi:hypothetical protein
MVIGKSGMAVSLLIDLATVFLTDLALSSAAVGGHRIC